MSFLSLRLEPLGTSMPFSSMNNLSRFTVIFSNCCLVSTVLATSCGELETWSRRLLLQNLKDSSAMQPCWRERDDDPAAADADEADVEPFKVDVRWGLDEKPSAASSAESEHSRISIALLAALPILSRGKSFDLFVLHTRWGIGTLLFCWMRDCSACFWFWVACWEECWGSHHTPVFSTCSNE